MENKHRFLARYIARAHCAPPSGRGSARALALRGRTCAPPLRRSLRRKAFRATLCVSHSRRRRSPSIPNLTINSATWRLSTPRSLPELIHTRVKCILSVSSVSCAQIFEKQGLPTSTSSSRRAATKSTAKALSLCGARCRGVWRSCAPELAPRCAAWCSLWGGIRAFLFLSWRVSRTATGARLGHARSHARTRESETSRAPPQVLAHGHTCSRKSPRRSASEFRPTHVPACAERARSLSRDPRNASSFVLACSTTLAL